MAVELGIVVVVMLVAGGIVTVVAGGVDMVVAGGVVEGGVVGGDVLAALAVGAVAKIITAQSALLLQPTTNEARLVPAYLGNNDMINASGRSNKTAPLDLG